MVHGFNSVAFVIDMWVAARHCRLLHFYQPAFALIAYFIFTVIYWASGGVNSDGANYIYAILDWNKPGQSVPLVICGLVFILPLAQALLWSVHLLRDHIGRVVMQGRRSTKTSPMLPLTS